MTTTSGRIEELELYLRLTQAENAEVSAALATSRDVAKAALTALQTALVPTLTYRASDLLRPRRWERLQGRHIPLLTRKRANSSVISLADRARDAGQWELAAAYYRTALRRKPENPPIWVQYGHVLKESGHLAEAEKAYRVALAYDQSIADSHLQLGHALKLQGKKEEALAAYMRAFALDSSLASLDGARFELAELGWIEAHFCELHGILVKDVPPSPHPNSVNPASRADGLVRYLRISEQIPGWIRGEEAAALALTSLSLSGRPVIVQIGTFFGSAAVLLAGARKQRGSGIVHCVDPFDCSGDDFSVPHYRRLLAEAGGGSLRAHFESNIRSAGLEDWIEVHQGRAEEIAHGWAASIDMLALGGDQSPAAAREAYENWWPFLKPGGFIAIHNSSPGEYAPTHDGNRRIVVEEIVPPVYTDIRLVVATTFARRSSDGTVNWSGG